MAELGYPAYFVTILGTWKVLGGVAILGAATGEAASARTGAHEVAKAGA